MFFWIVLWLLLSLFVLAVRRALRVPRKVAVLQVEADAPWEGCVRVLLWMDWEVVVVAAANSEVGGIAARLRLPCAAAMPVLSGQVYHLRCRAAWPHLLRVQTGISTKVRKSRAELGG